MGTGISKPATKKVMRVSAMFAGITAAATGVATGATGLAPAAFAHNYSECTGSVLHTNYSNSAVMSFWSHNDGPQTCIGTVQGAYHTNPDQNGSIDLYRVRLWHDGKMISSVQTGVAHETSSVTGGTRFHLWVPNPVEVCEAFIFKNGTTTYPTCLTVG